MDDTCPIPVLVKPLRREGETESWIEGADVEVVTDEPPGIPVYVLATMLAIAAVFAILLTGATGGIRVTSVGSPTDAPIAQASSTKPPPAQSQPLVVHRSFTDTELAPEPTATPPPTSTPAPTATPTPGPYGDADGNPAPAPELYPWANWNWRDYASHIVAGEAADSDIGRTVIACTLIRDVLQGWNPHTLTSRWFGWKEPDWDDRMSVWNALQPGGCRDVPWYRYVGSHEDYQVWVGKGMVLPGDSYDVYGNTVAVE